VFGRLKRIFGGGGEAHCREWRRSDGILSPNTQDGSGTERDPLHGYEAALERNLEAHRAEGRGDAKGAVRLYKKCVAEGFVGARPFCIR
jgi:hypothetical protein